MKLTDLNNLDILEKSGTYYCIIFAHGKNKLVIASENEKIENPTDEDLKQFKRVGSFSEKSYLLKKEKI
jgi:hypothetical protein